MQIIVDSEIDGYAKYANIGLTILDKTVPQIQYIDNPTVKAYFVVDDNEIDEYYVSLYGITTNNQVDLSISFEVEEDMVNQEGFIYVIASINNKIIYMKSDSDWLEWDLKSPLVADSKKTLRKIKILNLINYKFPPAIYKIYVGYQGVSSNQIHYNIIKPITFTVTQSVPQEQTVPTSSGKVFQDTLKRW